MPPVRAPRTRFNRMASTLAHHHERTASAAVPSDRYIMRYTVQWFMVGSRERFNVHTADTASAMTLYRAMQEAASVAGCYVRDLTQRKLVCSFDNEIQGVRALVWD